MSVPSTAAAPVPPPTPLFTLRGTQASVTCLAFLSPPPPPATPAPASPASPPSPPPPPTRWLAAGDARGRVQVWDVQTCRVVQSWPAHEQAVLALIALPGGAFASQGRDHAIHRWALADGRRRYDEQPVESLLTSSLTFCRMAAAVVPPSRPPRGPPRAGGRHVAEHVYLAYPNVQEENRVDVADWGRRRRVVRTRVGPDPEASMAAAAAAATGRSERREGALLSMALIVSPLTASAETAPPVGHDHEAAPPPTDARLLLLCGYESGAVAGWRVSDGTCVFRHVLGPDPITALLPRPAPPPTSPPSLKLEIGTASDLLYHVALVDVATSDGEPPALVGPMRVAHVRASERWGAPGTAQLASRPPGRLLVAAGWDGRLRLWKTARYQLLGVLPGHTAHVNDVVFWSDPSFPTDSAVDGAVAATTATLPGTTPVRSRIPWDSSLMASASQDMTIRLWSIYPTTTAPR
ncbi:hypothetical protein CXG81DRAFT_23315 [Caulochytrium protostelioides]|uniref:ASTRA-associated protein 1 n=1 Tax=Caulochytrium protostelioides TaxID=1555241 RepID=A0A4P9XES1_9FUNG|nr:hypothetical protein CXG81DRAFT_23315 [Caulochytrium protostelioides]|eukprot:RKP04057.1 hypothetical protein CXG81DRAFT_23315 [Caulochytrium protostelioides]